MRYWATLLIALFLLIISVFCLDRSVTLWSAKLSPDIHSFANAFSWLIAPEVFLVAFPTLFFLFFYLLRKKKASFLLYFIIAIPACTLGTDLLKVFFGRARPEELLQQGIYGFALWGTSQEFWSFPSGHATAIGAVMGTLAQFYPKHTVLCFIAAFLLSFCRIFSLSHYVSDLLAGIIVSFLVSKYIYISMKQRSFWEIPKA